MPAHEGIARGSRLVLLPEIAGQILPVQAGHGNFCLLLVGDGIAVGQVERCAFVVQVKAQILRIHGDLPHAAFVQLEACPGALEDGSIRGYHGAVQHAVALGESRVGGIAAVGIHIIVVYGIVKVLVSPQGGEGLVGIRAVGTAVGVDAAGGRPVPEGKAVPDKPALRHRGQGDGGIGSLENHLVLPSGVLTGGQGDAVDPSGLRHGGIDHLAVCIGLGLPVGIAHHGACRIPDEEIVFSRFFGGIGAGVFRFRNGVPEGIFGGDVGSLLNPPARQPHGILRRELKAHPIILGVYCLIGQNLRGQILRHSPNPAVGHGGCEHCGDGITLQHQTLSGLPAQNPVALFGCGRKLRPFSIQQNQFLLGDFCAVPGEGGLRNIPIALGANADRKHRPQKVGYLGGAVVDATVPLGDGLNGEIIGAALLGCRVLPNGLGEIILCAGNRHRPAQGGIRPGIKLQNIFGGKMVSGNRHPLGSAGLGRAPPGVGGNGKLDAGNHQPAGNNLNVIVTGIGDGVQGILRGIVHALGDIGLGSCDDDVLKPFAGGELSLHGVAVVGVGQAVVDKLRTAGGNCDGTPPDGKAAAFRCDSLVICRLADLGGDGIGARVDGLNRCRCAQHLVARIVQRDGDIAVGHLALRDIPFHGRNMDFPVAVEPAFVNLGLGCKAGLVNGKGQAQLSAVVAAQGNDYLRGIRGGVDGVLIGQGVVRSLRQIRCPVCHPDIGVNFCSIVYKEAVFARVDDLRRDIGRRPGLYRQRALGIENVIVFGGKAGGGNGIGAHGMGLGSRAGNRTRRDDRTADFPVCKTGIGLAFSILGHRQIVHPQLRQNFAEGDGLVIGANHHMTFVDGDRRGIGGSLSQHVALTVVQNHMDAVFAAVGNIAYLVKGSVCALYGIPVLIPLVAQFAGIGQVDTQGVALAVVNKGKVVQIRHRKGLLLPLGVKLPAIGCIMGGSGHRVSGQLRILKPTLKQIAGAHRGREGCTLISQKHHSVLLSLDGIIVHQHDLCDGNAIIAAGDIAVGILNVEIVHAPCLRGIGKALLTIVTDQPLHHSPSILRRGEGIAGNAGLAILRLSGQAPVFINGKGSHGGSHRVLCVGIDR